MKKILFIGLCLLGTALTANAQLKVNSDGTVYMNADSVYGRTLVNIGNRHPGMTYLDNYYYNTGLRVLAKNPLSTGHCIGVFGEACLSNTSQFWTSVGLEGVGGGANTGYNFGVAGYIRTNSGGAGIFGANQGNVSFGLSGNYAGYFYGPVHIEGLITATSGLYNPSDMRLKHNVVDMADKEQEKGSTLENLTSLRVLEYGLRTPTQDAIAALPDSMKPTGKDPNLDIRHYGVSAQDLKELYPDLVREGDDGYLSVNYVEMVPLLLRSLQELKAELDVLKGNNDSDGNSTARRESSLSNSADTRVSPVNAVLYQNTPNPFTAQTEIRFSLPDDAPQAYIYIFDMTGKMQKQIPVNPSQQSVTINGYELSAGIYLYSLVVGGQEIDTKRMILSK